MKLLKVMGGNIFDRALNVLRDNHAWAFSNKNVGRLKDCWMCCIKSALGPPNSEVLTLGVKYM